MNKIIVVSSALLLFTTYGWGADTAPAPDPEKGSIAASLRGWSPMGANRLQAAEAMFVRIEDDRDAYEAPSLIASNVEAKDGRIYLINVDPGRYAIVAYRTRGGNPFLPADKQWIFLEKPLIDSTIVTVAPGAISFAGEYVTGGSVWRADADTLDEDELDAADPAQVHYLNVLFPEADEKSTFSRVYGKNPVYLGNYMPKKSPGRNADAEQDFWRAARKDKDLGAAWDAMIDRKN